MRDGQAVEEVLAAGPDFVRSELARLLRQVGDTTAALARVRTAAPVRGGGESGCPPASRRGGGGSHREQGGGRGGGPALGRPLELASAPLPDLNQTYPARVPLVLTCRVQRSETRARRARAPAATRVVERAGLDGRLARRGCDSPLTAALNPVPLVR